jgi:hypothetical protein
MQLQSQLDRIKCKTGQSLIIPSPPSSYQDALLHSAPPKQTMNLIVQQQWAQAQAKIMACRIMVIILKEAEETLENTANSKIQEEINDILDLESDEPDGKHKLTQISRFMHKTRKEVTRKLLLEFNSPKAATWVCTQQMCYWSPPSQNNPHSRSYHKNTP